MEYEDLIKKLENTSLPEIELQAHKKKLRKALLASKILERPNFWLAFKRSLALAVPALVLLIIIGINIIQPRLIKARALDIARNDPEVQRLMAEKKVALDEVKIKNGKVYVLLNPTGVKTVQVGSTQQKAIAIQEAEEEIMSPIGAIVEIDMRQKQVSEIKPVQEDILSLAEQERELAEQIVQKENLVKEILSEEAKIERVKATFPEKLRLVEKGDEVFAAPDPTDEKKAEIYYTTDGQKWMVQVNLNQDRVEQIIRLKGLGEETE